MNPILEAISSNASTLPVSSLGQPASGQRRAGGFASTLAAAQGLSSASASSELAPVENLAGSAATDSLSAKGAQIAQPKKSLNSAVSAGANSILSAANNGVVLEPLGVQIIPAVGLGSQIIQVPVQREAAPLSSSGSAGKVASAGGQAIAREAEPAMSGLAQIPAAIPGDAEAGSDPTSYTPVLPSNTAPRTELNHAASQFELPSTSAATTLLPEKAKADALSYSTELPVADAANPTPAPNLHVKLQMNPQMNLQANAIQAESADAGPKQSTAQISQTRDSVLLAYNAQPDALSFTTELAMPATATLTGNTQAIIQGDLLAAGTAQSAPQPSQAQAAVETTAAAGAPILLANASPEVGTGAGAQTSPFGDASENLNADQEDGGEAGAAAVGPRTNTPTPAEIGNLFSGIASAPNVASPILSSQIPSSQILTSQVQAVAGRVSARAVASKANGVSSSPVAGAGIKTGSILQPSTATEAESGSAAPVASQSPFSVFFSSAATGSTESAASTLPKMILPGTTAASHSGSTAVPSVSAANQQSAGLQSGSLQSAGPQPLRDSLAGTAAGTATGSAAASATASLQTGQPLHSEPAAASASTVVTQVAATAATSAQASSPVVVLAAGQASVSGDSAPKPEVLPPATTGNPAGAAAGAVPVPPVLAPGPVQMAQMVNRVGQSEMRVGMNTSAFGNVEVRTVVHASDVGLTIGSEKGDLRGMLANDMPGIANTLQQQNLRLNNVNFMQGFGGSNHGSGGGDSQPRSFVPQAASADYGSPSPATAEDSGEVLPPELRAAGNSFSILA